jgi:hypothetical protein
MNLDDDQSLWPKHAYRAGLRRSDVTPHVLDAAIVKLQVANVFIERKHQESGT